MLAAGVVRCDGSPNTNGTRACLISEILNVLFPCFAGTAEFGRTSGRSQTTGINKSRH